MPAKRDSVKSQITAEALAQVHILALAQVDISSTSILLSLSKKR